MKYLKNYFLFLEKNATYDFGCVMIDIDIDNWKDFESNIDKNDLYDPENDKHGFETEPHLTLLYGLHSEVSDEDVESSLKKFDLKNLKIEIDGIGSFENDNFDVLKMNVKKTKLLNDIHNSLKELPNSDQYVEYNPHITIAYLKKGTSKKYLDKSFKKTLTINKTIIYSKPNGGRTNIKI